MQFNNFEDPLDERWMEDSISIDKKLIDAHEAAIETGRLTPLIKEELWTKIQARRLSNGLNELHVEFNKPSKSDLTTEEITKVEWRKTKNREAAQRCRIKRKKAKEETNEKLQKLLKRNQSLKAEVERLENEKAAVISMLRMMGTQFPTSTTDEPTSKAQEPTPASAGNPSFSAADQVNAIAVKSEEYDNEVEYHMTGRTPPQEGDLQIVPSTPTIDDYVTAMCSPSLPPPPPYPGTSSEQLKTESPQMWNFGCYFSNFVE